MLWVSLPLNRVANGSVQWYGKAYHISCQIRQTSYPRRLADLAGPAVAAFSKYAVSSVFTWRGSWVTLVAPAEKRHDSLCRQQSPGNVD